MYATADAIAKAPFIQKGCRRVTEHLKRTMSGTVHQ